MNSRQGQLSLLFLKSADLALILFALGATIVLNYAPEAHMSMPEYSLDFLSSRVKLSNAVLGGFLMYIWHYCFRYYGLYFSSRLSTPKEILLKIVRAVGASSIAEFAEVKMLNLKGIKKSSDLENDLTLVAGDIVLVPRNNFSKIEKFVRLTSLTTLLNPLRR